MLILFEPAMRDWEHCEVNAGFLSVVREAFPRETLQFWADASHLRAVRERLGPAADDAHIQWVPLATANRHASLRKRAAREALQVMHLLRQAHRQRPRLVLVLSVSASMLYLLKSGLRALPDVRCAVVPHSVLTSLGEHPTRWYERLHPMRFEHALAFPTPASLRLWLLGPSIESELTRLRPGLREQVAWCGHPYLFAEPPAAPPERQRLMVGVLGGGQAQKGTSLFSTFFEGLKGRGAADLVDFVLIGRVSPEQAGTLPPQLRLPAVAGPLPREQYVRMLRESDYALLFHLPHGYQLVASGAVFDAVAHARPLLALRNPFFQHLFEVLGDVGVLADSVEELADQLAHLARRGRDALWRARCERLVEGRHRLGVGVLAERLRHLVDTWEVPAAGALPPPGAAVGDARKGSSGPR